MTVFETLQNIERLLLCKMHPNDKVRIAKRMIQEGKPKHTEILKNLNKTLEDLKMGEFKEYRKKNTQPMRPYEPGEDLSNISVSPEDKPELGGMIAVNPKNPRDQWYVAKEFFEENYEPVD